MNITYEYAAQIARDFLIKRNPTNWDGEGKRPDKFDTMCCTYDFGSLYVELDIYFEYDEEDKEWCHVCEIVDKDTDDSGYVGMCERLSGYGINSYLNVVETILDICNTYDWFAGEEESGNKTCNGCKH